jgi:aspartyl-tRNA(Asn)/glutamyl-tRNA(Gln) amidotransferase subunit A
VLACFEGVDALLTPATTTPPPTADTTGDPAFNSPWSYTGLPATSLPAEWTPSGLPLSVQLVGRPWGEAALLATAAWCERTLAFPHREPTP